MLTSASSLSAKGARSASFVLSWPEIGAPGHKARAPRHGSVAPRVAQRRKAGDEQRHSTRRRRNCTAFPFQSAGRLTRN